MASLAVPQHAYLTSEPWIVESKPMRKTRISCGKYIERQVVRAWKRVTGVTRKHQRASFLPKDFILVTSHRRSVRLT
ncbi:uncharacterized protein F5891DRAFT_997379 [Suillus fuscotomentosus]|uniref:Uncharacterized protein n=1 Tax=Suillus fuscotomentosus TaxID=1912939 RepID=A0AAD4HRW7_9AGAM|nr:uncharacterized protein F5891DRAFT_997379 [Suillus fuscotomentosus]KAG1907845.1 hypothetical protein F5891DRAFT_997379 [Suillus fuscotomentosus]